MNLFQFKEECRIYFRVHKKRRHYSHARSKVYGRLIREYGHNLVLRHIEWIKLALDNAEMEVKNELKQRAHRLL